MNLRDTPFSVKSGDIKLDKNFMTSTIEIEKFHADHTLKKR